MRLAVFASAYLVISVAALAAGSDSNSPIDQRLGDAVRLPGIVRFDLGITRDGTPIPSLISADDLDYATSKTRILIVGTQQAVRPAESSLHALTWFYTSDAARPYRDKFALSAVPALHPDAWLAEKSNMAADAYPPAGEYYQGGSNSNAQYLWRWIGIQAPDLVVAVGRDSQGAIFAPEHKLPEMQPLAAIAKSFEAKTDLVSQLVSNRVGGVGEVPAVIVDGEGDVLIGMLRQIMESGFTGPSPARREVQRRIARPPLDAARELSQSYGHSLSPVAYIPALALIGRLRLGELDGDATQLAAVEKIAAPYLASRKPTLPEKPGSIQLPGHLVFAALAAATGNPRYLELAKHAADLGFDQSGKPKAAMPYHAEMSDSVFMGCPILVEVGAQTGEVKYHDMALRHLRFMQKLCLRDDGLYRHSPLDETAWGRGNGFPALGLALCLTSLPENHAGRAEMLSAFQSHMETLAKYQDATGMWHQVIDRSGSYREFSCTAMITFAMVRGVREGWLEEAKYRPIVERAWPAILARMGSDGRLVDVCTGTGKQPNLQAYLDRAAILGRDDRGGAMALLLATEMAAWRQSHD